jgi:hypothetical protein
MKMLGILIDFRIFFIGKGSFYWTLGEDWKNSCPSTLGPEKNAIKPAICPVSLMLWNALLIFKLLVSA